MKINGITAPDDFPSWTQDEQVAYLERLAKRYEAKRRRAMSEIGELDGTIKMLVDLDSDDPEVRAAARAKADAQNAAFEDQNPWAKDYRKRSASQPLMARKLTCPCCHQDQATCDCHMSYIDADWVCYTHRVNSSGIDMDKGHGEEFDDQEDETP